MANNVLIVEVIYYYNNFNSYCKNTECIKNTKKFVCDLCVDLLEHTQSNCESSAHWKIGNSEFVVTFHGWGFSYQYNQMAPLTRVELIRYIQNHKDND